MKYYAVWEGRKFPDGTIVSLHVEREKAEERLDRTRVLALEKWTPVNGRWVRTRIHSLKNTFEEVRTTLFLEVIEVNIEPIPSRLERIADLEKQIASLRESIILERMAESRSTTTTSSRETPAKRKWPIQ